MQTIRQTILNEYRLCKYKCFKNWGEIGAVGRYEEEESEGNVYSWCGVKLHEVMEHWAREYKKGNSLSLEQMKDLMELKLEELNKDLFIDKGQSTYDIWLNSLKEQIEWLYENACSSKQIIDIEHKFLIDDMFEGLPPFSGSIDRIEGSIERQDVELWDYKTGKTYTKKELNNNIQACIYSMAFYRQYGFLPKRFVFLFSKHKKTKVVLITQEFIIEVSSQILMLVQNMKDRDFTPSCDSKFFCQNFCEYYKECPKHSKRALAGWEEVMNM